MTTQESIGRKLPKTAGPIVQRLERSNRELRHLREKLRSYICEPRTYLLFERFEYLKERLEQLQRKNTELIEELNNKNMSFEIQQERYTQQLDSYVELEIQVVEYIGRVKLHG